MFDEKLIIKQFLEHHKIELSNSLNATNLTLVLRSLGFFLHEFDFASTGGNAEDTNLSIEIKCAHSGIISKLYLPFHDCQCHGTHKPEEKTYWEMHGNQPHSPNKSKPGGSTIVREAATNLLPEADHTWKILSKHMFNFMLCMQTGIMKYKDEQNNIEYEINEAASPASAFSIPDTPFSTPLSSINVTPIICANEPDVISRTPSSIGAGSISSHYSENSCVIALVAEAKAKLDVALSRMTLTSLSTEDVFTSSESLKLTPILNQTPHPNPKINAIRRRTIANSNSPVIKMQTPQSNVVPKLVSRRSVETKRKLNSPPKRTGKLLIVPQTRTSALRSQQKSKK